jgi:acetolactate synthase-1/2/3 large subunit
LRYFGRIAGADPSSGVTLPALQKIAETYSLPYSRIETDTDLRSALRALLEAPGPQIVEVMTPADEPRAPSLSSFRRSDGSMGSRPLEDLWPFLSREEFRANMIVPPLED